MGQVTVNQAEAEALKFRLANLYFAQTVRPALTVVRLEAPILTGRLRRSHDVDLPRRDGRGLYIRFRASTPYARFVYVGSPGGSAPRAVRVRPGQIRTIRHATGRRPNRWFVRAFQRLGLRDVRDFG